MRKIKGKLALIASVLMVLTACSGNKIVPTYEGAKLAKEQVAVLLAGENITLLSVNGEPVPKYLLSNIEVNYGLKPGLNRVTFKYRSVWANHQRDEDGPRAVEVSSEPREVVINAVAGDQLRFDYASADNVREARALAADFRARIINARGQSLAESRLPQPEVVSEEVAQPAPASVAASAAAVTTAATVNAAQVTAPKGQPGSQSAAALPAIEGLKVLWNQASSEERKAFLKWAFQ